MFDDLIEYEELHEACAEFFMFGQVTFKRDFGPWEKGQKISTFQVMLKGSFVAQEIKPNNIEGPKVELTLAIKNL